MCGLAGIWGEEDEPLIRAMMDTLAHRGPDAAGVHRGGAGTLGHRRLAIMDPAGGDQPIRDAGGRRAIIANGEVYNHPALQAELAGHYRYRTRSDTESALHLYRALGADMAGRLDGQFALAIADGDDLCLARDPIGIKPLYTARLPGRGDGRGNGNGKADATDGAGALVLASELKALPRGVTDVQAFPPGTCWHSRHGARRYYTLPQAAPGPGPEAAPEAPPALAARLRATLERAVVKRLMSDVPVGAFLSGGLDSSLVAALARPHVAELHTFSVGVAGSADLAAARRVARHLDTIHHEVHIGPADVRAHLPRIVYHLESWDPDSVRSAIPCYFVSQRAAQQVKVILTGEGADELFAGYRYHKDVAEAALAGELRRSVAAMHGINLQRVDRLTMAHALEGRVPFLDTDMVALALAVPAALKLRGTQPGRRVEKWILRLAAEGLLPEEIVWREKSQFDEGSGTVDLLGEALHHWLAPGETAAYAEAHPADRLRNHEECVYHKLLHEGLPDPAVLAGTVTRWSEGRL